MFPLSLSSRKDQVRDTLNLATGRAEESKRREVEEITLERKPRETTKHTSGRTKQGTSPTTKRNNADRKKKGNRSRKSCSARDSSQTRSTWTLLHLLGFQSERRGSAGRSSWADRGFRTFRTSEREKWGQEGRGKGGERPVWRGVTPAPLQDSFNPPTPLPREWGTRTRVTICHKKTSSLPSLPQLPS